jgi:hypothetical protein
MKAKVEVNSESNVISETADVDGAEAAKHLGLLGIDPEQPIWLETLDDARTGRRGAKTQGHAVLRDALPKLGRENRGGAGVYVAVNEIGQNVLAGDAKPRRKVENVTRIRAVWAELDQDGQARVDALPIDPTFIVESSPGKFHAYFVCDGLTADDFDGVMARMVADYGSDKNAKDRTRIMRLAGSWHMKDPSRPWRVRIIKDDGPRYSRDEILKAFPPIERRQSAPAKSSAGLMTTFRLMNDNEVGQVRNAAKHLHESTGGKEFFDRETWLTWGMALHHQSAGLQQGYALWCELSEQYCRDKYDSEDQEKAWSSFGESKDAVTLGTFFRRANASGWNWGKTKKGGDANQVVIEWPDKRDNGTPVARSQPNIEAFLQRSGITVYKDAFARRYYVEGLEGFSELNDAAERELYMLADSVGLTPNKEYFRDAILVLAERNQRHPLKDWLDQLAWDGVPRLDNWLVDYAGAEDTPLVRQFGRLFLIAAVRRARKPGTKFDQMLVLEGPQGAGKSALVRVLASEEWFEENLQIGADARQVIMQTAGKWMVEVAELKGIRNAEVESVKSFISRTHDRTDMKFERWTTDAPRHFVLVGTTNDEQYLRDQTGNRRFWPVTVRRIDLGRLAEDREKLWAEAAHYESQGASIVLDETLWSHASLEQQKREVIEPMQERVDAALANKDGIIYVEDLWTAVGFPADRPDLRQRQSERTRLGQAMNKHGWKYSRSRGGDGEKEGRYEKRNAEGELKWVWRIGANDELERRSLDIIGCGDGVSADTGHSKVEDIFAAAQSRRRR